MNDNDGGKTSSDLQRQAAAVIARKKVLAAYAESAQKAAKAEQERAWNSRGSVSGQAVARSEAGGMAAETPAHLKDEAPRINSESWKKYHTAWQDYYQKYYSEYYSKAARAYIEQEKLKQARAKAEEEEILESLTRSSARLSKKPKELGLNHNSSDGALFSEREEAAEDDGGIRAELRQKIRRKATESAKRSRKWRRVTPIIAGVVTVLVILFLQYNRLIFAPLMAYVSPGNVPAAEIEAIDPTIKQEISPDPRLIIPKLNVDVPIRFGVPLDDVMNAMENGVAHYRIAGASAYPGEVGNFVITGHSAGDVYSSNPYKYIFSGLERLEDGDLIYVNYESVRYTYRVAKKEVVEPTNVAALVVQTDKPLLTLVTCTPLGTSRYRLLVTGEQISPAAEGAETSEEHPEVEENTQELPSNEPSFFEGIWNWATGQ